MRVDRVSTVASVRSVIYAGRFSRRLVGAGLSDECSVLSEFEVLPVHLAGTLERADALVVLDLFSFPYEALTGEQLDVPLILVLPSEYDADFLEAVFGEVLFERLGFFDRVASSEPALWRELSRRCRWTESQRIELESDLPERAAAELLTLLQAERAVSDSFGDGHYDAHHYWTERGALARRAPHRAICDVPCGRDKAVHRAQAAVLEPQFAAATESRAEDAPFDVLEVGSGVGRWASSFDPAETNFVGLDISEGMVDVARANFPEARFDRLGPDLFLPYDDESFDLVFTVGVLHHNPKAAKRILLSEMWRVARPGGRLLFLEDFVAEKRSPESAVYPMSVLRFAELVIEATAGQVVLEHVESLRYPRDDVVRGGVIVLSKLGVPKTW